MHGSGWSIVIFVKGSLAARLVPPKSQFKYRIVEKCGEDFNLAVWWIFKKSQNLILANNTKPDVMRVYILLHNHTRIYIIYDTRLKQLLDTIIMALYKYFKKGGPVLPTL